MTAQSNQDAKISAVAVKLRKKAKRRVPTGVRSKKTMKRFRGAITLLKRRRRNRHASNMPRVSRKRNWEGYAQAYNAAFDQAYNEGFQTGYNQGLNG